MKKKLLIAHKLNNEQISVGWHYTTGQVESFFAKQTGNFSWMLGKFGVPTGNCFLDKRESLENGIKHTYLYMQDVCLTVERTLQKSGYVEQYSWQNVGKEHLELPLGEYGVYCSFAEQYDRPDVALPRRAYAHVFCGGNAFAVCNARMDGTPGGVGLVLQQGKIHSMGYEWIDWRQQGEMVAYLPAITLAPQERITWQWCVFVYQDLSDFWQKVNPYMPTIEIHPLWPAPNSPVWVTINGQTANIEMSVNGQPKNNGFAAPQGDFELRVEQPYDISFSLQGKEILQRWRDMCKRGQARCKKRRELVVKCLDLLQQYEITQTPNLYQEAINLMHRYYGMGGTRHLDIGLPYALIAKEPTLMVKFTQQVNYAIKASHRLYTRQTVLATYDLLCGAVSIVNNEAWQQAQSVWQQRVQPLLNTPFGPLL